MLLDEKFREQLKEYRSSSTVISLLLKNDEGNSLPYYYVEPLKRWRSNYFQYISKQQYLKCGDKKPPKKKFQKIKMGTFLKKVAKNHNKAFSNSAIERGVNILKFIMLLGDGNVEIKIVSGKDLKHIYFGKNYKRAKRGRTNNLSGNCMRHRNSQNEINFYIANGVKALAMFKKKKVLARCLLWDDVESYEVKTNKFIEKFNLASKPYAVDDVWKIGIQIVLKKKKYKITKSSVGYYYRPKTKLIKRFSNPIFFKNFPFLDVFKYFSIGLDSISNTSDDIHFLSINTHHRSILKIDDYSYTCPNCKSRGEDSLLEAIFSKKEPAKAIGCNWCLVFYPKKNKYVPIKSLKIKEWLEIFILDKSNNGLQFSEDMKSYLKSTKNPIKI